MISDHVDHLRELFAPLGRIAIKRMFGGAGIYVEDVMIALMTDDVLYLKTDTDNRALFEAEGLAPFSYDKRDAASEGGIKRVITSYYRVPDEAMDSATLMLPWARSALGAALRSAKRKRRAARN